MRRDRRYVPTADALEPRLALSCQITPIDDPAPAPLPSIYLFDPLVLVPLDPPPLVLPDPTDPVDVPVPK